MFKKLAARELSLQIIAMFFGLSLLGCGGCDGTSNLPKNTGDPQKDFQSLVEYIKGKCTKGYGSVKEMPQSLAGTWSWGGKWMREERHYSVIDFDAKEKDSIITPYVGTITIRERKYMFLDPVNDDHNRAFGADVYFDSYESAMKATEKIERKLPDVFREIEHEYVWKDGRWQHNTPHFFNAPISDKIRGVDGEKIDKNTYRLDWDDRPATTTKTYYSDLKTND